MKTLTLVSINNGMTVNLTAPTSGTYKGILFLQERSISNPALSHAFIRRFPRWMLL